MRLILASNEMLLPGSCLIIADTLSACLFRRLFFDTSVDARGVPQSLTAWSTYDPRNRSWYTEESARSSDTGGWSSIYVFSSSGELGITRTAKLRRDGRTVGVLGIDFELHDYLNKEN